MTNNEKDNNFIIKLIVILGIFVLIVGIAIAIPLFFNAHKNGPLNDASSILREQPVKLSISCVGDIMVHSPQIPSQYDSVTSTYDYNNNFEFVKKYIEASDLAICNVETTFGGGKYAGYPLFNAPEQLADAVKNAGWDVAVTANNHCMDTGFNGLERTIRVSREAGLVTTGTMLEGDKNYAMITEKGINIAVIAYTYETSNINGTITINGNSISSEAASRINSFNYDTLTEDMQKIKNTISEARKEGADIVVCYFHWGEEYQRSPNDYQLNIARQAADMGADMIFASHPHVLQGVEMLKNETTGKQVPVFYSMGNFISNQRLETLNNRYTEQGIIAEVNLEYMKSTKEILTIQMDAIPVWVDKYKSNGKDVYSVVPLDDQIEANTSLAVSGHLQRAQQALSDVKELLGEEYIRSN
ncbi:CapA family protein [Anaerovorax odorimutans]|uniref:CapA family protein n=1 Tax=Anaerovorax odorimutans TaxID=109327 RepID=UPI0003FBE720|nr:CapA family protein [Anaerovorax odorimutans]